MAIELGTDYFFNDGRIVTPIAIHQHNVWDCLIAELDGDSLIELGTQLLTIVDFRQKVLRY